MTIIDDTKNSLPFGIFSSSVNTGYNALISASFAPGRDIANLHIDTVGNEQHSPMQGPFTQEHVGGNQFRHVALNTGSDDATTRPEGFVIDLSNAGELRVYGSDFYGTQTPRASMLRGNASKGPVNVRNIRTTTGSAVLGNFTHDYEIVHTSGRKINNRHLVKTGNLIVSASNSSFVTGLVDYALPVRDVNKFVFVERFNAPGGTDVSSRGVLDIEAEEYAPNNALPFRNLLVRLPLRTLLTQHAGDKGQSSFAEHTGSWWTDAVSGAYHKTNKNTLRRTGHDDLHDNWYVQHEIPQNDLNYSWITASAITSPYDLGGHQRDGAYTNRGGAYTDIVFSPGRGPINDNLSFSFPLDAERTVNVAGANLDQFGKSVSLNGRGDAFVVGINASDIPASFAGSVAFYKKLNGSWQKEASFETGQTNWSLGQSVSMNSEGTVAVVGAPQTGATATGIVQIFKKDSLNGWELEDTISRTTGPGFLGESVSINSIGDVFAAGAYGDSGSVYVYRSGSSGWAEEQQLDTALAGDQLGFSVAINAAGDFIAAGAWRSDTPGADAGSVHMFRSASVGGWYEEQVLETATAGDRLGGRVAINDLGDVVAAGSSFEDATHIFRSSSVGGPPGWAEEQLIAAPTVQFADENFGSSVALNSAGNILLVGSPNYDLPGSTSTDNSGVVYIYQSGSLGWSLEEQKLNIVPIDSYLDPGEASLGTSVSINSLGDVMAAGAPLGSSGTDYKAGSVNVYTLPFQAYDYYDHLGISSSDKNAIRTFEPLQVLNASQAASNSSWISLPNTSRELVSGSFSISYWMYMNDEVDAVGNSGHVFINEDLSATSGISFSVTVYGYGPGDYRLYAQSGATLFGSGLTQTPIGLKEWIFVTITFNESEKVLKAYVNGTLEWTEADPAETTLPISAADNFVVGMSEYYAAQAKFKHFAVWNKELASSDVEILYRKTKQDQYPKTFDKVRHTLLDEKLGILSLYDTGISGNKWIDATGRQHGVLSGDISKFAIEEHLPQSWQNFNKANFLIENGPYQHPSWKQIRGGEKPIVQALRRQNKYVVQNPSETFTLDRWSMRRRFAAKHSSDSTIYVEPPVSSKYKPIDHRLLLKGSVDPLAGQNVRHTYANNLNMFANKDLNARLSLENGTPQTYDKLLDFYSDPDLPEEDNPISRFLGLTYSEVVFPKEENTYLARTRGRTEYITDQPGFGKDGYDGVYGTQRAFWRDSVEDRKRSVHPSLVGSGSALNSQGWVIEYPQDHLVLGTTRVTSSVPEIPGLSVYPFDVVGSPEYLEYSVPFVSFGSNAKTLSTAVYTGGGELNNEGIFFTVKAARSGSVGTPPMSWYVLKASQESEFKYPASFRSSNSAIDVKTKYLAFLDGYYFESCLGPDYLTQSFFDAGLQWRTAELAGKNPWYDSYEQYADDIRAMGKDYSIVPAYNISEHMEYFLNEVGGNFRSTNHKFLTLDGAGARDASAVTETSRFDSNFFKSYSHTDLLSSQEKISSEHKNQASVSQIKLKCKGIKKLLPYNGFYPATRTVQLSNLFSQSILPYINGGVIETVFGGPFIINTIYSESDIPLTTEYDRRIELGRHLAALQPFFAPGIMYNTIKSGIAVDFPSYTGSYWAKGNTTVDPFMQIGGFAICSEFQIAGVLDETPNYRIPFESIIFPTIGMPRRSTKTSIELDDFIHFTYPTHFSSSSGGTYFSPYFQWNHTRKFNYELAASNFFSEVVKFFIKDQELVSFVSKPAAEWSVFSSNKKYYMDISLEKTENFVMMEASRLQQNSLGYKGEQGNGRYFGFPCRRFNLASDNVTGAYADPAYAPYTPPYFEGESIARITFSPSTNRRYTLEEIFASSSVEYIQGGLESYTDNDAPAISGAMKLDASITLFGKAYDHVVEYDLNAEASLSRKSDKFLPLTVISDANDNKAKWVISTKMETPILDFSSQAFETVSDLDTGSIQAFTPTHYVYSEPDLFNNGYGRGMWSGYGAIPTGSEGIFFQLKESFPTKNNSIQAQTTGSLIESCGFQTAKERVGELADNKEISEAIIAIPFLENASTRTTFIDGKNLIKIDRTVFDTQRNNITTGQPAIKAGDLGSTKEIRVTSVSDMIDKMENYVVPPQFNFLSYSDIEPFAMYIFEFKHNLDKQDLADIWQGVMPKIAMTAEKDEIEVSHPMGEFEFFGTEGLPDGLRWMVFKIKKKAEKNYYAVTADSTDDDRFQFDFEVGRKAPEYSYNWPYDYFSLVELAKLEVELEYEATNDEEKLRQANTSAPPSRPRAGPIARRRGR